VTVASTAEQVAVREVTDEEVAFFHDNGWGKLERLIEPEVAAGLLEGAKRIMENPGAPRNPRGWWETYYFAARDDHAEPFSSLVYSPDLARAATKIMDRRRLTDADVPVRLVADLLTRKRAAGSDVANAPTTFHTDLPAYPIDRAGAFSFWIALDEVPPERGSMRFLSGSHREGLLGQAADVLETYPKLRELYELSPPLHLQPGDATIHDWRVVHGGPENSTDRPRWAYIVGLMPGDCRYTGMPSMHFDNLGLEVGQVIDHPRLPQLRA
jgi:hypothetical protein